jgi:hypothetical protein
VAAVAQITVLVRSLRPHTCGTDPQFDKIVGAAGSGIPRSKVYLRRGMLKHYLAPVA